MVSVRVLLSRGWPLLLVLLLPALVLGQQPTFRAGVELVRLDVSVVGANGAPVTDLTPSDFEVTVKGARRPVVSAQFLSAASAPAGDRAEPQPGDFSSNTDATGRLFLVVVDESRLVQSAGDQGKERPMIESLRDFIASLPPRDRVSVITIPMPTARVDFTNDSKVLRAAVDRIHAFAPTPTPRQAIDIARGEGGTTTLTGMPSATDALNNDFDNLVDTLCALAKAVTPVEGPKNLLLIAGRLPGGAGQLVTSQRFARAAAEARMKVYAIRYLAVPENAESGTGTNAGPEDPLTGFHMLAGMSGGAVFDAVARAKGVWEQVDRETQGSYVLGIDPPEGVAADTPLEVKVKVTRPGVTVRSRTQVVLPAARDRKDAKTAVRDALQLPRPATDLTVRLASYAARGAEASQLKTVVVAEVPGLAAGDAATWGYEIRSGGKPLANTIEPMAPGTRPGAVMTATTLAPGSYTLRFAVAAEDGRVGSVDHPLTVAPHGTPRVGFSDLFVGEAVNGRFQPRVTVDRSATDLVAFVEVYAASGQYDTIGVEFELEGPEGPVGGTFPATLSGSGAKRVAQASLPIQDLPQGTYRVKATVSDGDTAQGTVTRGVLLER